MNILSFGATASIVVALTTTPVFAAPASAPANANQAGDIIEEIVVTSRRRSESQQDVPLSVTAFNADAIEQIKPTTLRDFDGLAPNVYIGMNTAGPSASALYIRGVGYADIEKSQTPQVGVIVDGVQMGSSTGQLIDVFDVESIEINRGPQGVLFGKNTIGGNIVVNRVRPDFEGFGVKASVAAGDYQARDYKLRLNIPLNDSWALKLGAIQRERDGYYDNETLGQSAGDVDFAAQTVALRFKPNERIDAILTYDRIDDTSQIPPQDPRYDGDDPFVNLADKEEPALYRVDQLGLRVDLDLSDRVSVNSITGWNDAHDRVNQDFDGGPITSPNFPFAQLHTLRDQEFETFTQELRFNFAFNTQVDLMLGAYFYDSALDFNQRTNNILQLAPKFFGAGLGGLIPPENHGDFIGLSCAEADLQLERILGIPLGIRPNPALGDALCQFPNARSTQIATEDVESTSFFGAITYRPVDTVELSLGARAIDEKKKATNAYFDHGNGTFDTGSNADEFNFQGLPTTAGTSYQAKDDWDDTIVMASASWRPSNDMNLYASYSEGFRSGGFSIRSARSAAEALFEPETGEQVEIGLKSEWFDRRLRVNLAYFELKTEGVQFSSIITLPPGSIPGTTTLINNSDTTTIKGWELETRWIIDEQWALSVNGGILDVDNEPFTIACELVDGCATDDPGVVDPTGTLRNLGGHDNSRQPDWNASVNLSFGTQVGPGFFSALTSWKKVGDFLLVETGGGADQRLFEGGYKSVDASLSYDLDLDRGGILSFSIYGKNLTDEEWKEQALFLGGPTTGFQGWGAPKTVAFEVQITH